MSFEKQAQLVKRLIERTAEGKVDWKLSARNEAFQVSFRNFTVQISVVHTDDEPDILIELVNDDGQLADAFTDRDLKSEPIEPGNWYSAMTDLYSRARRFALGVDKALDSILSELE